MSIKLTTEKSTLEKNLENIEAPLILVENCVRTAIQNLNSSFDVFWSLPDNQIEEILNYFGPQKVQEVFGAHFENAFAFNKLLDSRGVDGIRATVVKPREITMDENGIMALVPLPVPVIEEPPAEEPIYYDEFGNPIIPPPDAPPEEEIPVIEETPIEEPPIDGPLV